MARASAHSLRTRASDRRRISKLRRTGVLIGRPGVELLGDNHLAPTCRISHHASVRSCTIERQSAIGRYAKLAFADVGPFCSVSWDTTVGAIGHPMSHASTHAFPYVPEVGGFASERRQEVSRIRLGADVWIGCNTVVLPGVTVGTGAVIGASALVREDVEPYTVVAGIPARTVARRFPEALSDRLLASAWWLWPDTVLGRHIELFQQPLDESVLDAMERISADLGEQRTMSLVA